MEYGSEEVETIEVVIGVNYGSTHLSDRAIKLYNTYSGRNVTSLKQILRHDKNLVKVVKELGKNAEGERICDENSPIIKVSTILEIRTVRCHFYRIIKYDGQESVETPNIVEWYDGRKTIYNDNN